MEKYFLFIMNVARITRFLKKVTASWHIVCAQMPMPISLEIYEITEVLKGTLTLLYRIQWLLI